MRPEAVICGSLFQIGAKICGLSVLAQGVADAALGELPTGPGWLSQGPPTVGSMPPLPRITGRELVRALGKHGWVVVVQKGSHAQLRHPSRGGRVTVPLHAGRRSALACSARS
jgi:predicted RNA binding protein YcfA (HicA-like mRNA interferase family)